VNWNGYVVVAYPLPNYPWTCMLCYIVKWFFLNAHIVPSTGYSNPFKSHRKTGRVKQAFVSRKRSVIPRCKYIFVKKISMYIFSMYWLGTVLGIIFLLRYVMFMTATTQYFYTLKICGAILPQNKQILCLNFTIKQHYTVFSRETQTDWQRATS
jgi:hypothetical protein